MNLLQHASLTNTWAVSPRPVVLLSLQIQTTARRLMFSGATLVGGSVLYFAFSIGQDHMGPPNAGRSLGKVVGDGKLSVRITFTLFS